jgi:hypothetical protein
MARLGAIHDERNSGVSGVANLIPVPFKLFWARVSHPAQRVASAIKPFIRE